MKVLDDSEARNDWGWMPKYGLAAIVESMIRDLQPMYK